MLKSLALPSALAGLLAMAAAPAQAAEQCPADAMRDTPPQINIRVDNDLFGGRHQDQGYTSGALLTLVSPNLVDYTDDPCLPRLARWVNSHLEALHPGRYEQQNMIFTVGQGLYTPTDGSRRDLIPDDRPYAAVLMASFGFNARSGDRLQTTQLGLGVVGPWALGKQVQQAVHDVLGDKKFEGWDNQLHNEPVFMLTHERMRRWPADASVNAQGWGWDAISHYGGALGNFQTHANAGGEVRFGWKLPDDFGSTPLRPAGENTAPSRGGRASGWSWHLFATTDAAWVLRDITLDGNTFRNSHSVDKRHVVATGGYGVAVMYGRWKFAVARYHSTREFYGQQQAPVFGSFTISRSL
ncbi:lipid A deacylase LpxR family protein [Stenotrophomonas sp. 24(2023)]|uniref:lipid A deacylase LpxR family protein n=1 Tax=Stenotrophomonas sp. 24(2023) TaxID=3068324 RepID=UPI0027E0F345|nr:lipid A deacylase LpxR family protein [Stenotrophomonas sp. 24(2023)]WMJ70516.1 lipid A deacylase LpxR family protein [Stenotrophomonas sp. 24(2023)]